MTAGPSTISIDPPPPAEPPANQWQLRYTQNPNNIWENGIAYDPWTGRVLFHGGHVGRLYPQSTYTFMFDLAQNRFYESQAPLRPQRRCLISFGYIDSIGRAITCHGGASHGSMLLGELLGGDYTRLFRKDQVGPWLYDTQADEWEDCRTLPPRWERRAHAPIAYDCVSDLVWTIGKTGLMGYVPRTNRVIFRKLPDELIGRSAYGLAADPARRKLVLFGGKSPGGSQYKGMTREQIYDKQTRDDTWVYDIVADSWKKVETNVRPPRGMPGTAMLSLQMVYHSPSGKVVLLQNGVDRYEADNSKWGLSELWTFDAGSEKWEKLEIKNPLPFMGLMTYAAGEDLLIVFGGGRDGLSDNGKVSPACSRQIWTCRLRLPGESRLPFAFLTAQQTAEGMELVLRRPLGVMPDVYRATVGPDGVPGPLERIAAKPGDSFIDPAAADGKTYAYYSVLPGRSPSMPVFNQSPRPAGLRASVESAKKVVLRWNASDNPTIIGYKVYRADGKELETGQGKLLTGSGSGILPLGQAAGRRFHTFTDEVVDLSDGIIRTYWVTAVNKFGIESGPSPLAHTVPDAPEGFTFIEGIAKSNGVGVKEGYLISWRWPADQKVAGFNLYHATEHIDTLLHEGGYEAFWKLWTKLNDKPVAATEYDFRFPKDMAPHHYFYVRPVNVLGQEGFATDIVSPTDRRFRP